MITSVRFKIIKKEEHSYLLICRRQNAKRAAHAKLVSLIIFEMLTRNEICSVRTLFSALCVFSSFNLHNHPLEASTVVIPRCADAETSTQRPKTIAQGDAVAWGGGIQPRHPGLEADSAITLSSSKTLTYDKSEHPF